MYKVELALALAILFSDPGSQTRQAIEATPHLDRAKTVLKQDYEAWRTYAFQRHVRRQKFDAHGEVIWSAEYLFKVTPKRSGFDENLIEIDGRRATPGEVGEHRKAARFEKHYKNGASLINPFGRDIPLLPLLFDQNHQYVGRKVVGGELCHKTEFVDRNPPAKLPARARLAYVLKGEACFSVAGDHLVAAEMETAQPVSSGVTKLKYLKVRVEAQRVGEDLWLPSSFEIRSEIRLGMRNIRKNNLYEYSHYRLPGP
jgi:hypothetical protein